MSIGEKVRDKREAFNLTQRELAEVIGITPQHLSLVEQDKKTPSVALLTKMAQKLGVSIDYLVFGENIQGGTALDPIVAIKADKSLSLKAKRTLIAFVELLRATKE